MEKTNRTRTGLLFLQRRRAADRSSVDHSGRKKRASIFAMRAIEVLKGMRTMLDARIEHLSKHAAEGHQSHGGITTPRYREGVTSGSIRRPRPALGR